MECGVLVVAGQDHNLGFMAVETGSHDGAQLHEICNLTHEPPLVPQGGPCMLSAQPYSICHTPSP